MRYDPYCFERWGQMEATRPHEDECGGSRKCAGYCDNEATVEIDGAWYCEECAELLEEQ